eukprot:scaffold35372_cov59-Attheya_sp.AAC.1
MMADEETPAPSMAAEAEVLLTLGNIVIDHARISSDVSALTVVDSGITSEEDVTLAELSSLIPALLRKLGHDALQVE